MGSGSLGLNFGTASPKPYVKPETLGLGLLDSVSEWSALQTWGIKVEAADLGIKV